jgi:hypothetical protein
MAHFNDPRPLYRWQLGLLLLSLPRRFIPAHLCDFPPGRADQSVPYPVGQTGPGQLGSLPNQTLVLGSDTDEQVR